MVLQQSHRQHAAQRVTQLMPLMAGTLLALYSMQGVCIALSSLAVLASPLPFKGELGAHDVMAGLGHVSTATAQHAAPPSGQGAQLLDEDPHRFTVYSVGYPILATVSYYPWHYIVEPFHKTVLRAPQALVEEAGGDAWYSWKITYIDGDNIVQEIATEDEMAVSVEFQLPTQTYQVEVGAYDEQGSLLLEAKAHMICKYVRREIRSLTDQDRQDYFQALGTLATTELDEGQRRYGEKFRNLQYMMVKHVHNQDCSPFHNGNGFFTAHAAFTLELDQALQTVRPKVIQPYWEYTLDAALYGNDWFLKSPMFRDDWFGAATPATDNHVVTTTWAAGIPVPIAFDRPVKNSYGVVTNNVNNNPSKFVTRAHSFCGLENRIPLPGCFELYGCMTSRTTLGSFRECVEGELHSDLHMGMGGVWDCHVDLGNFSARDPAFAPVLGKLGLKTMKFYNVMWKAGLLICPNYCSSDTGFHDCACSCPSIDNSTTAIGRPITFQQAYEVFQSTGLSKVLGTLLLPDPMIFEDKQYPAAIFAGLDPDQSRDLWAMLLDYACHPGQMGNMGTGTSSGDIIFWPLHPFFDRLWTYMRLDKEGSYATFDWSWDDSPHNCYGHNSYDALPFKELFGESNSSHYYSNSELVDHFDPRNPAVPYVFDSFSWSHCEGVLDGSLQSQEQEVEQNPPA